MSDITDSTYLLLKILYDKCHNKDPTNITFINLVLLLKNMGIIDDTAQGELMSIIPIDIFKFKKNLISLPRYTTDFIELNLLGSGGFGNVFLVKNKIDKCKYAIKKIYLNSTDPYFANLALNEVYILSRLSHQNPVVVT